MLGKIVEPLLPAGPITGARWCNHWADLAKFQVSSASVTIKKLSKSQLRGSQKEFQLMRAIGNCFGPAAVRVVLSCPAPALMASHAHPFSG